MHKKQLSTLFSFFIAFLCLSACQLFIIDRVVTAKPDPCTGWKCEISGTIFAEENSQNLKMNNLPVNLKQISWCSPTAGEQTTITDADGKFSFNVFLHDTDSFVITIDHPGYAPYQMKFGGFDCLYCHCLPLEIIVGPE